MAGAYRDMIATGPEWSGTIINYLQNLTLIKRFKYDVPMRIVTARLLMTPKPTCARKSPEGTNNRVLPHTVMESSDINLCRILIAALTFSGHAGGKNDVRIKFSAAHVSRTLIAGSNLFHVFPTET